MENLTIEKDNQDFEAVQFCCQATGDKVRYDFQLLQVGDGIMSATDGERLYQAFVSIPDGYYLPVKILKSKITLKPMENFDEDYYPDVFAEYLWPEHKPIKSITGTVSEQHNNQYTNIFLAKIIKALPEWLTVNSERILNLTPGSWQAHIYGDGYFTIENGYKWALIAPMEIGKLNVCTRLDCDGHHWRFITHKHITGGPWDLRQDAIKDAIKQCRKLQAQGMDIDILLDTI